MTIIVLLIAVAFAMGVTPLVRQFALRINFVAIPKSNRAHSQITPMMGGVALYIGLAAALLLLTLGIGLFSASDLALDPTFDTSEVLIVLLTATIVAGIGLLDDWHELNPPVKLAAQILPVAILVALTDIRINMPIPDSLNLIVTFLWFFYLTNALNYMDNMDGVAAMTSTIAAMFFTVITLINGQVLLAALAAALAGTSFGFLRYNLFETERKIFMGDAGSLFLGYMLAVIGIKLTFAAESPWITWPVPVLVLGLPIFDTGLVFISRFRRGQRFLDGGTDHLAHRFNRLELGRYGVPFGIGLLGSALGCLALIIMHSTLENSLAAQLLVAACGVYLLYKLEFTATYEFITGKPRPQPDTASTPEGSRK